MEPDARERGGVLREALHGARLARHALDQHPDSHPTRERVRVDDHVRLDPALAERHVDGGPLLRAHALLAVPRGKLVADDGGAGDPQRDVDLLELGVARVGSCTDKINPSRPDRRKEEARYLADGLRRRMRPRRLCT